MKIKEAIKEVNSDIVDLISKLKLNLVLQFILMAILAVGTVVGGFVSVIWTVMAVFMEDSKLGDNMMELLISAYTVFIISGYALLVFCKVMKEK